MTPTSTAATTTNTRLGRHPPGRPGPLPHPTRRATAAIAAIAVASRAPGRPGSSGPGRERRASRLGGPGHDRVSPSALSGWRHQRPSRRAWSVVRSSLAEQVLERLQVGGGLAAVLPPGVLAPDRAREAQLQQGVEVVVGGVENLAEHPVDLV